MSALSRFAVLGVLLLCDAGSLAWAAAGHHAPRVLPAGALAGVVIGLGTAWLVVAAVGLAALAFLLRTGRLSL